MELEWLKNSTTLMSVNFVAVSMSTILTSASAAIASLLGRPCSLLFDRPAPLRESTLRIMARLDAFHLDVPCSGSWRMVDVLGNEGIPIDRDRIRNPVSPHGFTSD